MNYDYQVLREKIKKLFSTDFTGHDFNHLERVFKIARSVHEKEGGDFNIIGSAALTHDLHRIIKLKNNEYCSPLDSLPVVKDILLECNYPADQIERILHCVEYHEEYSFTKEGKTVNDIETLILQDADNLDAIGAIGIARTFAYGGAHGEPMFDPQYDFIEKEYDDAESDHSVIHHFHRKLLKLYKNMNTETGKQMALQRHEYMISFLDQFMEEWNGNR